MDTFIIDLNALKDTLRINLIETFGWARVITAIKLIFTSKRLSIGLEEGQAYPRKD